MLSRRTNMTHKKSALILMALLINSLAVLELGATKKVCCKKNTSVTSCCDTTVANCCDKTVKAPKSKKAITITILIDGINFANDADDVDSADSNDSDDDSEDSEDDNATVSSDNVSANDTDDSASQPA